MEKPYFPVTRLPLLVFWLLAATSLLSAQSAQPVLLKDIAPGADSSNAYGFTDVNGTVFFATDPGTGKHTLWRSNGTAAAGQTVLLHPHRVTGEHELEIGVEGLKSGLYLLRLQGGPGAQVIRFIKQ